MNKVKETLKENTRVLDPYAAMVPALVMGAQKADVNPGLILASILSVVGLVLLVLQGWNILLTSVTVLFPTIHSIRAIESGEKSDDKVWLTYWMIFGLINVVETFFGFILNLIPYYSWMRLLIFIWLLSPYFNGRVMLYEKVARPFLEKNQDYIRELINQISSAAEEAKNKGLKQAKDAASDPSLLAKGISAVNAGQ